MWLKKPSSFNFHSDSWNYNDFNIIWTKQSLSCRSLTATHRVSEAENLLIKISERHSYATRHCWLIIPPPKKNPSSVSDQFLAWRPQMLSSSCLSWFLCITVKEASLLFSEITRLLQPSLNKKNIITAACNSQQVGKIRDITIRNDNKTFKCCFRSWKKVETRSIGAN